MCADGSCKKGVDYFFVTGTGSDGKDYHAEFVGHEKALTQENVSAKFKEEAGCDLMSWKVDNRIPNVLAPDESTVAALEAMDADTEVDKRAKAACVALVRAIMASQSLKAAAAAAA